MRISLLVLCLLLVTSCGGHSPAPPAVAAPDAGPLPLDVLHGWDARRAAAYSQGKVGDLRELYVDGSAAGRADVRLLRRYVDRGLVVVGMHTQVLAVDVLRAEATLLRLRVTDRLVGAGARWPGGTLALPRDSPTTRVLTLRKVDGGWLMETVSSGRLRAAPAPSGPGT